MSVKEENSLIKKGENAYYGCFVRYLWRNEKNGNSFFQISTKQKMLFPKQFQKKVKKHNREKNADETWYTITCDGSSKNIPFFEKNTPVKVTGYFLTNKETESWDFKVTSVQTAAADETVLINYLASGQFEGVDYESAVKMVHQHSDFFDFLAKEGAVQALVEETGLSYRLVQNMAEIILSSEIERRMFAFLSQFGVSYSSCAKAVKFYGSDAEKRMRENPYRFGHKINLSFVQCDQIARSLGMSGVDTKRLKSAALDALTSLTDDGNTWAYSREFYHKVGYTLSNEVYPEKVPTSVIATALHTVVGFERQDETEIFYKKSVVEAEMRIADNIRRLSQASREKQNFNAALIEYAEKACDITYGKQQALAFPTVLDSRGIKLVNGGPGTGKTTTIKGIILAYQRMHPDAKVKLCAPSGRAAQRMSESTGMSASTVHRLLDYRPFGDSEMHKDAADPIDADLIIVDEMSMMGVELFDIFLDAVKTGTTLILVGDIDQLEAVGPGAIFRDLLNTDEQLVQKVILTEIFRQKEGSPIIENSKRINNGDSELQVCDDFQVIKTKNSEESLEIALRLMKELYNPDDPFETQILCPANKGDSGVRSLNIALQSLLNSEKGGVQYGMTTFKEHDKIIMFRNNYSSDYYNGDIGTIKKIDENKRVTVEIRGNEFQLTKDMLDDIHLSYGMTIHKSQGSEFKNVIIVLPMEPKGMLVRNLIYTAVTRAKQRVIIINEGSALQTAVKITRSDKRKTMLSEFLADK